MALNKVMLIGNVGNDPEIRYLDSNPQSPQGNAKVASFRLATTERYRDRNGETRENTEWHNIVAWRSNADLAEKFIRKGSQVYIEGKLRTRQWTDQSGNKRFTTEVQADNIQLLGKRPDAPQGDQNGTPGYPAQRPQSAQGGYQGGYSGQGFQSQTQGYQTQGAAYQGQGTGYQGQGQSGQPGYQGSGNASSHPGQSGYTTQPGPIGPSQPAAPAYAPQPAQPAAEPSAGPAYPAPGDSPNDDLPF